MTTELTMPALSPTMEKGTLAKWLVAEGDNVAVGDLIAEIETDKATMEFEAAWSGRIEKLLVAEGTDDVAVGNPIALLSDSAGCGLDERPVVPVPVPVVPGRSSDVPKEIRAPSRTPAADRIQVSPLAARIAAAKGIDLMGVAGTGPNGRIVRADVVPARARAGEPSVPYVARDEPVAESCLPGAIVTRQKLTAMRRTIARRLSESKQSVPHFYLTVRCNLDAMLGLRKQINAAVEAEGFRISVNDMLMKAMALALVDVPDAHVHFGEDELLFFSRVDIAMAVAVDGGLVTPVIRDVASSSLSRIGQMSRLLSEKARAGRLLPEDYQGGTVSVSNLGMFGIDGMVPVITPPQALIFGFAAGIEQPWNVDGRLALANVMAATASFDHRAIDGVVAARFMAAFRAIVETPLRLIS